MNLRAYFERIDYHGSTTVPSETLRALQVAHLQTVPFENLSIHAREPIVLEDEALFDKIVERRRGGFCYEVNGLFSSLLRAVGFEVVKLSAEVANPEGGFGQPFDHLTLMADLEQRWLVDVGFGDSFLEPLLLDERSEQVQDGRAYRIDSDSDYLTLNRRDDDEWRPQYRFTLQPHEYEDFAGMCRYHQTSPQSHFTQGRICSRATKDGRITLSEMRFITTSKSGGRTEQILAGEEELQEVLQKHFGVIAPG